MKHLIGTLTLIGLIMVSDTHAGAQTVQVARDLELDLQYAAPQPYYISDGLNGNEVYPKVSSSDPLSADLFDRGATTSQGCDCCAVFCCDCPPSIQWELDWLNLSRAGRRANRNILGGPDTANFGDLGFTPESGYRVRGALGLRGWELEGVYSNVNPWRASATRQLTRGVAFDSGLTIGGAWLGQNFINQTTLFSPIFAAASGAAGTDEFDGFGPGDGLFAGDTLPTLTTAYRSELDIVEVNLRPRHFTRSGRRAWRLGVGFAHATLDEFASASLSGTYRAQDVGGGPFSGGLTHTDLTDPGAGNLTLISGPGNGFDDQTGGTQAPNPDILTFLYEGTADNTLNGVQLLLDGLLYESCRWRIRGTLKAGIYDNRVQGSIRERYTEVTGDGDVYGRDFRDDTHQVAFLGNVGLSGAYEIRDWLHVRGGYEVSFLSGVALAAEQAVSNGAYTANSAGSLTTHGFTVGLEGLY